MSHVPTAKKHKRKTFAPTEAPSARTYTPTAVVHKRTEAPSARTHTPTAVVHKRTEAPSARTHTPTVAPTSHFYHTDAHDFVPPMPLNATLFMDGFNHTDPPMPMPSEGTLLYSSTESDSAYTKPGVYVGAMFLLPMVVLGAWIIQGRVRRRHYDPIPGDDFP